MKQVDIDKMVYSLRFYLRAAAGCRVILTGAYTATFAALDLRHVARVDQDGTRRHALVFIAPGGEFAIENVVQARALEGGGQETGLRCGRPAGHEGPALKFVLLHADGRQTRMVLNFRQD